MSDKIDDLLAEIERLKVQADAKNDLRKALHDADVLHTALRTAVTQFLYDANMTPPWESAGATWGQMVMRLNRALVDTAPPYTAKPPPTPMPSDGTPRSSI